MGAVVKFRKIHFYRNYVSFTGGEFKFRDYVLHTVAHPKLTPEIVFSDGSNLAVDTFWQDVAPYTKQLWEVGDHSIYFLAGQDWKYYLKHGHKNKPVINFIQGLRHADPASPLYQYLKFPAIRICVSPDVANAIKKTGVVNGPVIAIENSVDQALLACPKQTFSKKFNFFRRPKILICGYKNPIDALCIYNRVSAGMLRALLDPRQGQVTLITEQLPRLDYLQLLQSYDIAVFFPNKQEGEGFYLPSLEAMAMGKIVVCPDVVGNRCFSVDGYNGFLTDYTNDSIISAICKAQQLSADARRRIQSQAIATARKYSPDRERECFYEVLDDLDNLWSNID